MIELILSDLQVDILFYYFHIRTCIHWYQGPKGQTLGWMLLQFTPAVLTVTEISPLEVRFAKGWMPGKPHSLAMSRQQVPEQGVNSNTGR